MSRWLSAALTLIIAASSAWAADLTGNVSSEQAEAAIERAIDFLLRDQNANGSWGGPRASVYSFGGGIFSNPEAHRSWVVATTGLATLALLEAGDTPEAYAAVDRALDYLTANADLKRPSEFETWNNWGHIYGLQGLVAAYAHPRYANSPRRDAIKAAAELHLHKLGEYQALSGGWGYLEGALPRTRTPQWSASFMTAAAVVAMYEAREAGFDVDQRMFGRAVRAVKRARLPSGAYTYTVRAVPTPRRWVSINNIKGSLGRIPLGDLALRFGGEDVPLEQFRTGIAHFFREHRFLDIAVYKPIPHEAYYQNSGYFYYFGHYYAARVIELLPAEEQALAWPRLRWEVLKYQGADGAAWDYGMHAYHKPYGTAYALLALDRSVRAETPPVEAAQP